MSTAPPMSLIATPACRPTTAGRPAAPHLAEALHDRPAAHQRHPISRNATRAQSRQPAEVAPAWLRVPPMDSGLPVTDPGRLRPWTIDRVSISQAMTRPSVLTSGAGMSASGRGWG